MYTNHTSRLVYRWYTLALASVLMLNLFLLPPASPPSATAQGLRSTGTCQTDPSFDGTVFALTTNNHLLNFNPRTPGLINSVRFISGLNTGESIIAIDFQPATGQLFGVSSASRLYLINPSNGRAFPAGAGFSPALSGTIAGIDFNPMVDRLRVVCETGQNLRLNPANGAVAGVDTNLSFAADDLNAGGGPSVTSLAFTNNLMGLDSTTLYGIDTARDVLVMQGSAGGAPVSPNTGQLTTIGPLGLNARELAGFDIASGTNAAYAALTPQGEAVTQFYSVNLATGAVTHIGPIGAMVGNPLICDIAIQVDAPALYGVTASNNLVTFSAIAPGVILSSRFLSGLLPGETIADMDFRPATGEIFALSSLARLLVLNPATGVAKLVTETPLNTALQGTLFGIDFNPVADRLRLVTNSGQNLRINPATGIVAANDGNLAFASGDINAGVTPNLVAVAYTNSLPNAVATTLYGIDGRGLLVRQGSEEGAPVSPNTGQLFTIGPLFLSLTGQTGFDIAPGGNLAYLALTQPGSAPQLYNVNLDTGATTLIGSIGLHEPLRVLAVGTQGTSTVPSSSFLLCLQDDRTGDHLQINTCTGDYQFTQCSGNRARLVGRGVISRTLGFKLTLRDARVQAEVELRPFGSLNPGYAVIHPTPLTRPVYTIKDTSQKDSTCNCR
jgi:hypothetical protein